MRCPNCGKTFETGNQCPHCHIDAVLFRGTEHMSDRLYNQGLARLHSMDFTHGIQALRRSLSVNKHNIHARNLLGLALFEIGHIGEALKHWIISQSQLKENNPAHTYMEKIKNNTRNFERLNEAVVLYNRALDFVKQNSDDLAVIQLKKALEYNPRFVDALNLLTLCYLHQRNRQQASATMERVFTIDIRNPVASRYYSILNPARIRPEPRSGRVTSAPSQISKNDNKPNDTGPFKTVTIKEKRHSLFNMAGVVSFILGALLMLIAYHYLYIPGTENIQNRELINERRLRENMETAHQNEIQTRLDNEKILQEKIDAHQSIVKSFEERIDLANRTIDVYIANERFRLGGIDDLRAAVNQLAITSLEGMRFDTVNLANHIRDAAFPRLADHYATSGIDAFNANDNDFALNQLTDAYQFIAVTNPQYPHVLYHLGTLLYRIPGREAEAINILTQLIELDGYATFPTTPWSNRRTLVQTMLSNLGVG
jgi:tetratricopeptide (TPR) repeat protein